MRTFCKIYSVVMIVVVAIFLLHGACGAEETGRAKAFAGVVWDKEGGIVMVDAGIEYVNPDTFQCLDPKDYFKHNKKVDLNVDCIDWKHEKNLDKKDLRVLNNSEVAKKEAIAKMSSEERFRIALAAAGINGEKLERYVLVTERAVYPDTKSKGITYWYTFVPREIWKDKN